jgi:hypothetical protein
MPDDSSIGIILNGWKSPFLELTSRYTLEIKYPDLTVETSLGSILEELIIPPEPEHIRVLWGMYNSGESIPHKIADCLDRGGTKPSWKQIAKVLKETPCERLYQIASQNSYRLEYVCDHANQKFLQKYNNTLVECLVQKCDSPSPLDLEIKALFDRQGLPFGAYKLLCLIDSYYRLLLPYPYRLRRNPEAFSDYTKINAPEASKKRIVDEVLTSGNRLKERFAFYKYCTAAINGCIQQIDEKSKQDLDLIFDRSGIEIGTDYERGHAARVSRPRNGFVSFLPMMERAGNLFQCPFCYRFDIRALPEGPNQFPQLCDQPECKKAHESWSKNVRRAGFSSENKA